MKKFGTISIFLLCFALFVNSFGCGNIVSAEENTSINIHGKVGLLYDVKSGEIVYEKNSHEKLPIASMTKLASLLLVFEEIEKGNLKESDVVRVSKSAADTEGSSAFLDENSEYLVSDLIMTVIVCSANDSTVALAERVAGSEDNFVKMMNNKAKELGLENTKFTNSTGLPALDHYSTANDISKIYLQICDNPIYKKYSKIWMTELVHSSGRKTDIVNTNRLIKTYSGCDSGKTGFTNDAGFCLVASATRGDMRLIGVVMGADNSKDRFNSMSNLFDYGFNNFENKIVINKDNPISSVTIKNSLVKEASVYPENDFVKFLKKGDEFKFSIDYKLDNVKAPLKKGDIVGTLYVLDSKNIVVFEDNLIVNQDIESIKIKDILNKIYNEM